jgi:type IV secretion system protein VirB4
MTETRYCLGIASLSLMLAKSNVNEALVDQSSTRLILRERATDADYIDKLRLTPAELELLKKFGGPASRRVQLEQASSRSQDPLDPAAVDDMLPVLSTTIEIVDLLDAARAQAGDNPDDWLPVFYRGVRDRNASNPRTPAA